MRAKSTVHLRSGKRGNEATCKEFGPQNYGTS